MAMTRVLAVDAYEYVGYTRHILMMLLDTENRNFPAYLIGSYRRTSYRYL